MTGRSFTPSMVKNLDFLSILFIWFDSENIVQSRQKLVSCIRVQHHSEENWGHFVESKKKKMLLLKLTKTLEFQTQTQNGTYACGPRFSNIFFSIHFTPFYYLNPAQSVHSL